MPSWDDLRIFLAVTRHGTHARAGRALDVDPTTVGRRVAALEASLGGPLLWRTRNGLVATADGARLAERAARIEVEVLAAQREAAGGGGRALEGAVRITAGDGVLTYVLAPALGELLGRHPGLRIELRGGYHHVDLSRSDADVAIRFTRPREALLVARRLGVARFGLFASESYLARHGRPTSEDALAEHALIAYESALDRTPYMTWLLARARQAVRVRSSSTAAMVAACVAGQGIAIAIPAALRGAPGVVEVLPRASIPTREVWGVMHRDLRRNARLQAVLDWAASALASAGMRGA